MGVVREVRLYPVSELEDPDDYRLNSKLAVVVDEWSDDGEFVDGVSVIVKQIAPGERIPLHTHSIEEVIFVDSGEAEVTLGNERHPVGAGAIVFVPARTPHGTRAVGDAKVAIRAVFPSRVIDITYLERNPAPGTEDDLPQPPLAFDVRALVEGDVENAIRPVEP